jgi:general L-amino acid transport system substrate-binding protein
MRASHWILAAVVAIGVQAATARSADRLERIRHRGFLTCGIASGALGFSAAERAAAHAGLDVDVCRAISAAIFGTADRVKYAPASRIEQFLRSDDIDVVSRRLTWELRREAAFGLLFGPIIFYDGQGFLVAKGGVTSVRALSGAAVCVAPGSSAMNLAAYFRANALALDIVLISSADQIDGAFAAGRCKAYSADISELGAIRSRMTNPAAFAILPDQISKEPLAQVVRQGDDRFFDVLRWSVFALIGAEELGVTSKNVDAMLQSDDPAVRRLLGVIPGNGRALGLEEAWAYHIIKTLGNYGEVFDRDVGSASPIGLERGRNALWTAGGLMYAPPLR